MLIAPSPLQKHLRPSSSRALAMLFEGAQASQPGTHLLFAPGRCSHPSLWNDLMTTLSALVVSYRLALYRFLASSSCKLSSFSFTLKIFCISSSFIPRLQFLIRPRVFPAGRCLFFPLPLSSLMEPQSPLDAVLVLQTLRGTCLMLFSV